MWLIDYWLIDDDGLFVSFFNYLLYATNMLERVNFTIFRSNKRAFPPKCGGWLWYENVLQNQVNRKEMRWKKLKKIKIFNFFSRSLSECDLFFFLFIYLQINPKNKSYSDCLIVVVVCIFIYWSVFVRIWTTLCDYDDSSSGLNRTYLWLF